jgi:hypothetical protein
MVNENAGNERNMNRTLKAILLSAGLCSLPSLCFSAVVYDNTLNSLDGRYSPTSPGLEFGDEINLVGTDRTLSRFTFYYFFDGVSVGAQTVTVRMYNNSGANPPVTPFYTSDAIPLSLGAGGFNNQSINIDPAVRLIPLPDTFTWTVQFSNLTGIETGSLLLYSPPNPGTSFDDFWENNGTVWNPMQINNTIANFAAQVTAVPEPGVLALAGLGALLLAGLRKFRKAPR